MWIANVLKLFQKAMQPKAVIIYSSLELDEFALNLETAYT